MVGAVLAIFEYNEKLIRSKIDRVERSKIFRSFLPKCQRAYMIVPKRLMIKKTWELI